MGGMCGQGRPRARNISARSKGSWLKGLRPPRCGPCCSAQRWHRQTVFSSRIVLLECFRADPWLGSSSAAYHAGHPEPRFRSSGPFSLSVLCRQRGGGSPVWHVASSQRWDDGPQVSGGDRGSSETTSQGNAGTRHGEARSSSALFSSNLTVTQWQGSVRAGGPGRAPLCRLSRGAGSRGGAVWGRRPVQALGHCFHGRGLVFPNAFLKPPEVQGSHPQPTHIPESMPLA